MVEGGRKMSKLTEMKSVDFLSALASSAPAPGGGGGAAMAGALAAFGFKFMFNPVWWLCGQFLLSGMVGSARMILRQHNLRQLYIGFIVGVLVGFFTVIFV